ncbi:MAG: nitrogen regulation protein NR(II) [Pseudomonadota bacterium]
MPKSKSDGAYRSQLVLDTIRDAVLMVDSDNRIVYANLNAEYFFSVSTKQLLKMALNELIPFSSPLLALIEQVRSGVASVNEYRVDLGSPRMERERSVDIHVTPVSEEPGSLVIALRERTMADKFDQQLTHRSAARSVTGLAAMLGHEIKNPLSGIRGAAQLLEANASDDDRALTQLIRAETDRIVQLVDRMEIFSDERPIERESINIHVVLNRVISVAKSGFARQVTFHEQFDPSLPPVLGNKDQLIQVFLNLVKNAAEACAERDRPEITLRTAFRPGVRLVVPGTNERVSLPLEFTVEDNGPGVPDDIRHHMFDPFITTKTNGSGLGLALVAKIVGDHGGIIECESETSKTQFRVLMPKAAIINPQSDIILKEVETT